MDYNANGLYHDSTYWVFVRGWSRIFFASPWGGGGIRIWLAKKKIEGPLIHLIEPIGKSLNFKLNKLTSNNNNNKERNKQQKKKNFPAKYR